MMSAITKGIRKKKQKSGYSDPNISKPIPNLLKRKPKEQRKKRRKPSLINILSPLSKQWAVKKGGRIHEEFIEGVGAFMERFNLKQSKED